MVSVADALVIPVMVSSLSRMSLGPSSRRVALVVAGLVLVGATGACAEGGKITIGEAGEPPTTTAPGSDATTMPDVTSETTTTVGGGGSATTTVPGGAPGADGAGAPAADEDAIDNSWVASPGEYRGQDGLRVAYNCPAGGTLASLWGTGPFTDDSSVCTAGVFLGLITTEGGGRIVIEIAPGQDAYAAGEGHGVAAASYGTWAGSFDIVR